MAADAIVKTTGFRATVVVLSGLMAGCGSSVTAPTPPPATSAVAPAVLPSFANLPPLSGPSRTFVFERELSYPVAPPTSQSHFVLYDNGALELLYPPEIVINSSYRGVYLDANGVLRFELYLQGGGTNPAVATATLAGDSLEVDFSISEELAGFEDAVYVLTRS